jgi:hypothetical protein
VIVTQSSSLLHPRLTDFVRNQTEQNGGDQDHSQPCRQTIPTRALPTTLATCKSVGTANATATETRPDLGPRSHGHDSRSLGSPIPSRILAMAGHSCGMRRAKYCRTWCVVPRVCCHLGWFQSEGTGFPRQCVAPQLVPPPQSTRPLCCLTQRRDLSVERVEKASPQLRLWRYVGMAAVGYVISPRPALVWSCREESCRGRVEQPTATERQRPSQAASN